LEQLMSTVDPSQISLNRAEQEAFRRLARPLEDFDPVAEADEFIMTAQLQCAKLPVRVRRAAARFRRLGSSTGGFLIHGLPVDPLPPTPEHADFAVGVGLPAARVFALAAALFGEQYGFQPELAGRVVQDILPVAGFEDTQQSISSRALLELHCETVFTDNRADMIGLLCLRPDPERIAGTVLTSTSMFLPMMDKETINTLYQPRFSTTVDGSFLRGSGIDHPITIGPIRVLDGGTTRPRLRCDFAETRGLDDEAQAALDSLYKAACATLIEIRLEAGDMLLIDNHDAFHGRTSFRMHQNGEDRWLLRTFITRDLSRSSADRPGDGRIVDANYAVGANVMTAAE
jgi:L-asparagine oxygenase